MRCGRAEPAGMVRRCAGMLCIGLLLVFAVAGSVAAELPKVRLEAIVTGIPAPIDLAAKPDGSGVLFIADQSGRVYALMPDGKLEQVLDIRHEIGTPRSGWEEGGLLGMALHPDFLENGSLYLNYTVPGSGARSLRVAEFRISTAYPYRADPNDRNIIMETPQPQNHNGGGIAFGPDGYLYIALGDGGGHLDPYGNGQNTHTRQGTIMRVAVTPGQPGFTVPPDNPFAGTDDGLDEIWAWGLRNPFRISFDRATGHLFVGNVGQELWESIFIATHPANFGWSVKEGAHWFAGSFAPIILTEGPTADAKGNRFVPPVVEYGNSRMLSFGVGTSVVGVQVYRGEAFPELHGKLIFGDFRSGASGRVFVAHPPEGWEEAWKEGPVYEENLWDWELWFEINEILKGVAVDHEGELYLLVSLRTDVSGQTGIVYKVVPAE